MEAALPGEVASWRGLKEGSMRVSLNMRVAWPTDPPPPPRSSRWGAPTERAVWAATDLGHRFAAFCALQRCLGAAEPLRPGRMSAFRADNVEKLATGTAVMGLTQCLFPRARKLPAGGNYLKGVLDRRGGDGRYDCRLFLRLKFRSPDGAMFSNYVSTWLAYLKRGLPPQDEWVAMHLCERAGCINPDHICWATKKQDAQARSHKAMREYDKRDELIVTILRQNGVKDDR